MKKLPTLPPITDEDEVLHRSETDHSEEPPTLPVDTDLEIAEQCGSGSCGPHEEPGTPFLVKNGRRHHVEPFPVPAM